jgi:membrane protein implicated in regulation of membrane protease activity
MKKNVGGIDRIARIIVGSVLCILAAIGLVGPWGWLGLIVLGTGVFSFCMPYQLFGISTCALKNELETAVK